MNGNDAQVVADASPGPPVGSVRWVIAGLLFLDTILNYIDYMSLSVLAPRIIHDLGMTDRQYGQVVLAFQISFMAMFLLGGFVIDRVGVRWGMALALGWWSIAQILHGFARNSTDLIVLRLLFGLAYPGAYICAAKVVSQWFPPRERALVTGIYTAGAALGATISPVLVGRMYELYQSWRPPFFIFGGLGILYVIVWLILYRPPEQSRLLSNAERDYILSGRDQDLAQTVANDLGPRAEPPFLQTSRSQPLDYAGPGTRAEPAFLQIIRNRYFWAITLARLIGDSPWGFYTSFVPLILDRRFGMSTAEFAKIGWIPFLFSDFGSLGGGWLSGWLIRRGWQVLRARLAIMLVCACATVFTFTLGLASSTTLIIALLCLFMFTMMAWMVNLSTIPNDTFPEHLVGRAVGLTTGLGACLGQLALNFFFIIPLMDAHRYTLLFVIMSFTAPLGFVLFQVIRPPLAHPVPAIGARAREQQPLRSDI